MGYFNKNPKTFFLNNIRVFFGAWLLYVGLFKWLGIGPAAFADMIAADFEKTWSPHALNIFLAWLILFAEPILGVYLLSGKDQRIAWGLTAMLMFLLTIGQTILMKPDVIANWQYVVLTLACASLSESAGRSS